MGTEKRILGDERGNTNVGFVALVGLVAVVAAPMFGSLGTSADEVIVGTADAAPVALAGRGMGAVESGNGGQSPAGDSLPANLTGIELGDSEPVEVDGSAIAGEGAIENDLFGDETEVLPEQIDESSGSSGGGIWGGIKNGLTYMGDSFSDTLGGLGGMAANAYSGVWGGAPGPAQGL